MQQNTRAFKKNLSIIHDELHLARQWRAASIILTTHKSTISQDKTKEALRKELANLGYSIVELRINKIKGNFVDTLLQHEQIENIVFFVSNIDWGGGEDEKDCYRTLNLHRESFIEQNLKVVFFLTLREASNLPHFAPDFWAFRHRVLEFRNPRPIGHQKLPVGLMLWHIENPTTSIDELKSKISNLTQMLAGMPEQLESISVRADLYYEIGFLRWQLGDLSGAELALMDGMRLAEAHNLINSKVKCQNGLSIVRFEQENYEGASEMLESLVMENPKDCILILNQAVVLFARKKRYRAIRHGKKAISACTQNPWIWNSLGFLYFCAGYMDEAATCFQEAIRLSSKVGCFYLSLSTCYLAMGLQEKARVQLDQARNNLINRCIFQDVLKECIEVDIENASRLIETAIRAGELTKIDVTRDPILNALFFSTN